MFFRRLRPVSLFPLSLVVCAMALLYVGAFSRGASRSAEAVGSGGFSSLSADRMLEAAIYRPLPPYPREALANGAGGVAVAFVRADHFGKVQTIEILQAPDVAISDAVRESLEHWVFPATPAHGPGTTGAGLSGKIVLYFRIVDGTGSVSVR